MKRSVLAAFTGAIFLSIAAPLAHAKTGAPEPVAQLTGTIVGADQKLNEGASWRVSGTLALQDSSNRSIDLSILLPILIALVGIAGAYWNNTATERRKAKMGYVSDQLRDLYGPLYSLSHASEVAWNTFRNKYRPGGAFFNDVPLSSEELTAWMAWIRFVFTPMNESMVKAIVDHADLIDRENMPKSFLELIAHVEGYRVVLKQWDQGNYSTYVSLIGFPDRFKEDVEKAFNTLKTRQLRLMTSKNWIPATKARS